MRIGIFPRSAILAAALAAYETERQPTPHDAQLLGMGHLNSLDPRANTRWSPDHVWSGSLDAVYQGPFPRTVVQDVWASYNGPIPTFHNRRG